MPAAPTFRDPSPDRFRLTASAVASHFKYRCDRRFRWNVVPSSLRGRRGIGWGARVAPREETRPGVQELMHGGDRFEVAEVEALRAAHGEAFVWAGVGPHPKKPVEVVGVVPYAQFLDLLRAPSGVRFVAQPQLGYDERARDVDGVFTATDGERAANAAIETAFAPGARLDTAVVGLGLSRPDLIEFVAPDPALGQTRPRLRVWDFKASRAPRHDHFIQVAWYTFLLEAVLRAEGIDTVEVDTDIGAVRTYEQVRSDEGGLVDADARFELAPYRLAIEDFLRQRLPVLLATAAADAHYHVTDACMACEHVKGCRDEAVAGRDVSCIPYLASDAKRRLAAAGVGSVPALAAFAEAVEEGDDGAQRLAERLARQSHDLKVHLRRHLLAARALDDGEERWLDRPSLVVPTYEDVRVVVCAERDAVTHRAFAFGLKTYEGWDDAARRARGMERAYVSEHEGDEAEILTAFLDDLFGLLDRIDAANRAVDAEPIPEDDRTAAADAAYQALRSREAELKALRKAVPSTRDAPTRALRQTLDAEIKALGNTRRGPIYDAIREYRSASGAAAWARAQRKRSAQVYVYDPLDLRILSEAVERHLFDPATPADRYARLRRLASLMPPASVLPDPGAFRSVPVVVVQSVLRQHVALPVRFGYDLATVSERFRAQRPDGGDRGHIFRTHYGFVWEASNQIAFERIHDVWKGRSFAHASPNKADGVSRTGAVTVNRETVYSAEAIRATLDRVVRDKLAATDSVVVHLKAQMRARGLLLFRKEPFALYDGFDAGAPLDAGPARLLDALHVFSVLEESVAERAVKTLHTYAPDERAARDEAIHGLVFEGLAADDFAPSGDGPLYAFRFDEGAREARIAAGEMNVVLTDEADARQLLVDVDGPLHRAATRRGAFAAVEVVRVDAASPVPRLWLRPKNAAALAGKLTGADETPDASALAGTLRDAASQGRRFVLDKTYADYTSHRVIAVLDRLRRAAATGDSDAAHIVRLVADGWDEAWTPTLDADAAYGALDGAARAAAIERGAVPRPLLNAGQRRAFDGTFASPVALVWGPPGTGKSHTLAHVILAHAIAAQQAGQRRVLYVTAFTHLAVANLVGRAAALARAYGLGAEVVGFAKLLSASGNAADAQLPPDVRRVKADARARLTLLADIAHGSGTLVVGGTVWAAATLADAAAKAAAAQGETVPDETDGGAADDAADAPLSGGPAVTPLFDTIVVDEASQMKLPDALVAFSTLRPGGSVVLGGDDRQLPPIIQGTYPEEAAPFLTSVFAFMRHRMDARVRRGDADAEARTLYLLDENFRMNEPLTAYPREVLYGTFRSMQPAIEIALDARGTPGDADDAALVAALLDPARPVVLVRYRTPTAYTARNPIEADLAARLVAHLARGLIDPSTGAVYTPEAFAAEGVAVVAPHRAQNAEIRRHLAARGFGGDPPGDALAHDTPPGRPMPLVDTVDKAQGQEFDVVVVSYGVADETYAEAESAFLLSRNRFNVALTRARRKAIVLVSDAVVEVVPTDRQVLLDAMMLKAFDVFCCHGAETHAWRDGEGAALDLRVSWRGFGAGEGG